MAILNLAVIGIFGIGLHRPMTRARRRVELKIPEVRVPAEIPGAKLRNRILRARGHGERRNKSDRKKAGHDTACQSMIPKSGDRFSEKDHAPLRKTRRLRKVDTNVDTKVCAASDGMGVSPQIPGNPPKVSIPAKLPEADPGVTRGCRLKAASAPIRRSCPPSRHQGCGRDRNCAVPQNVIHFAHDQGAFCYPGGAFEIILRDGWLHEGRDANRLRAAARPLGARRPQPNLATI